MTSKKTKLDRGQVLALVVENSRMKKGEVAIKAGYSRSAYYKHVAQPDLKDHILINYGKALKYDFTEDFPAMAKYTLHDSGDDDTPRTIQEAILQRDEARRKYSDLLEKYTALIEERWSIEMKKKR